MRKMISIKNRQEELTGFRAEIETKYKELVNEVSFLLRISTKLTNL